MGVNVLALTKYIISLVLKLIYSIDHKRGPGIYCLTIHEITSHRLLYAIGCFQYIKLLMLLITFFLLSPIATL